MIGSAFTLAYTTHIFKYILLDGFESGLLTYKRGVLSTFLDHLCALLKGDRAAFGTTPLVFTSTDEVLHIEGVDS